MSFLLINLVVLAVVAAAGALAYSQMLQSCELDEWMAPAPGIDYAALQAHWHSLAAARDWESSQQAQVRRSHEAGAPGPEGAHCDEVARNLNQAVCRFAVPGEPMVLGRPAAEAVRPDAAHCPARLRARARA